MIVGLLLGSSSGAAAASSENAGCVEMFNVAVGTPGEFQRVFHQDKLGRNVSFFARLGENCPFGQRCSREAGSLERADQTSESPQDRER